MKAADQKTLGEYVRWVANELGLRDWELRLQTGGVESLRALAEVECLSGRRVAVIDFCLDFRDESAERQRMAVVHELVHCHLAALQDQCENDLDGLLGGPAAHVFFPSFRRNLEYAVDGITEALTKHLPLIDWPK